MRLISALAGGRRKLLLLGFVLGVALTTAFVLAVPGHAQAPPAGRIFNMGAGMVLNYVKADKTADFEMIMSKTKEALNKGVKPERKQQAASWKVYKAAEPGPNNSVRNIFVMDPAVKDADYTVGNILNEAFPAEVQSLFTTFSESSTGSQSINLTLISNFAQ